VDALTLDLVIPTWYPGCMTHAPIEFDFSELQAVTVDRLRAKKVTPVPAPIIKLAQLSYDDEAVKELNLGSEERAAAFAAHMRNAGDHTKPVSSLTVVIDEDDKAVVRWRAGKRRGRASA